MLCRPPSIMSLVNSGNESRSFSLEPFVRVTANLAAIGLYFTHGMETKKRAAYSNSINELWSLRDRHKWRSWSASSSSVRKADEPKMQILLLHTNLLV